VADLSGMAQSIGRAQFELMVDDAGLKAGLEKSLQAAGASAAQIAKVFDDAARLYGLSFKRGADAAVAAITQANNQIAASSDVGFKAAVEAKARELVETKKFAAAVEQEYNKITGTITKEYQTQVDAATRAADAETKARNKAAFDAVAATKKARDDEEKAINSSLDKALKADQAYDQKVLQSKRTLVEAIISNKKRQVDAEIKEEERLAAQQARVSGGGAGGLISKSAVTETLVTLTGIGGFYAAYRALNDVLRGVVSATNDALQAQFQLDAEYGAGAEQVAKFAEAQAKLAGREDTEVKKGVALLGTIRDDYNLTIEQTEKLTKAALDLAASHGVTVPQAFEALQRGIEGNTRGLRQYGIVINDDVLKADKSLTQSQRENFSTLDEYTKAILRLNAILEASDKYTGQAEARAKSSAGAIDRLKASVLNAAESFGKSWLPEIEMVAQGLNALAEAAERAKNAIPTGLRPLEGAQRVAAVTPGPFIPSGQEARETAGTDALDRQAQASKLAANAQIADAKAIADQATISSRETAKSNIADIERQMEAARRAHGNNQRLIESKKTAEITASRLAERAELEAIDAKEQAARRYYQGAIAAAESARDGQLRAAEAAKDGAIKALDEEKQALDRTRLAEDQARQDSRRTEERFATDVHETTIRGLDAEAEAARNKSAEAVRGIEAQSRAEDERHRTAMRDIDDEEKRQLDAIDSKLRALDFSERMRSDKESIGNAQDRVRMARTWTERRAAEQALEDAKHRIGVDTQRKKLEDQARDVKKHFDEVKRQEQEHNEGVKSALEQHKLDVQETDRVELAGIEERKKAETLAYEQTKRDMQDRYTAEDHARTVLRQAEDQDLADRRKNVEEAYKAEQAAIHATYDDPVTGLIPALHRAEQDTATSYANQKKTVQDHYTDVRTAIDETAAEQSRQNSGMLEDTIAKLRGQKDWWTWWADQATIEIKRVQDKIRDGLIPDLENLSRILSGARSRSTEGETQGEINSGGTPDTGEDIGGGVTLGPPLRSRTDLFDRDYNSRVLQLPLPTPTRVPRPTTTPTPTRVPVPTTSSSGGAYTGLPGAGAGTPRLGPGTSADDFAAILAGYGVPLPPLIPEPSVDLPNYAKSAEMMWHAPTTAMGGMAGGDKTFVVNVDARGNENGQQIANLVEQKLHQFALELEGTAIHSSTPPPTGLAVTS
jgi:hypothetical protein